MSKDIKLQVVAWWHLKREVIDLKFSGPLSLGIKIDHYQRVRWKNNKLRHKRCLKKCVSCLNSKRNEKCLRKSKEYRVWQT